MNITDIVKTFGTPLSTIPIKKDISFNLTPLNVFIILVGVGFAAYGGYTLINEVSTKLEGKKFSS